MTSDHANPDSSAARLARRRDGVLSGAELEQLGLDRFAVSRRVAKGTLHRVHPGVFATVPSLGPRGRMRAGLLSCGEGAWLAGRSAAVLWEFIEEWHGPVEVVLHRRHLRRDTIAVRTTTWLPDGHRARRHGLAVTSPARTLFDLGSLVEPALHEHAIAAALRRRRVTRDQLRELIASRRPGAPALSAQLDRVGGAQFSRSKAERIVLGLVRQARMPAPVANRPLFGDERDLAWADARVVVEFDGDAFHWSPASKRSDGRRDTELRLRGWETVRLTWREITEEPLVVVARIAAALGAGYAR